MPALETPLVFESSMIRIRPDRNRMLAVYLYYYLTNRAVRENRVRRYVTISTISGINQDNLCRIEVVVPRSRSSRSLRPWCSKWSAFARCSARRCVRPSTSSPPSSTAPLAVDRASNVLAPARGTAEPYDKLTRAPFAPKSTKRPLSSFRFSAGSPQGTVQ